MADLNQSCVCDGELGDIAPNPVSRAKFRHMASRIRIANLIFNTSFAVFFCFLQVWPLVASTLLVGTLHFWIARTLIHAERERTGLIISLWVVALLQAFLAVRIVGPESGFQFYVLSLLPFNFSNARQLFLLKILQVLIIIVFFLACDSWFTTWHPVYALKPSLVVFLRHLNTIGSCAIMAGISYAHALSIQSAEETLHKQASTDTLTGLLNRRRLTEIADHEQTRHRRRGEKFSVLLCDIDHFKRINDHFGHPAGDHVLRVLANQFLSALRDYDSVARWGGEEFMVLLPSTDLQSASLIADRLRQSVASTNILYEEQALSVSMTLGVAEVGSAENWHAAVVRADEALYQGKAAGRNRVVLAQ